MKNLFNIQNLYEFRIMVNKDQKNHRANTSDSKIILKYVVIISKIIITVQEQRLLNFIKKRAVNIF